MPRALLQPIHQSHFKERPLKSLGPLIRGSVSWIRVPELDRLEVETYLASSGGGHRTDIWNWRETWPGRYGERKVVEGRDGAE